MKTVVQDVPLDETIDRNRNTKTSTNTRMNTSNSTNQTRALSKLEPTCIRIDEPCFQSLKFNCVQNLIIFGPIGDMLDV